MNCQSIHLTNSQYYIMYSSEFTKTFVPIIVFLTVFFACMIYFLISSRNGCRFGFPMGQNVVNQPTTNATASSITILNTSQSITASGDSANQLGNSQYLQPVKYPAFPVVVLNPGYAFNDTKDIGIALIELPPPNITTKPN